MKIFTTNKGFQLFIIYSTLFLVLAFNFFHFSNNIQKYRQSQSISKNVSSITRTPTIKNASFGLGSLLKTYSFYTGINTNFSLFSPDVSNQCFWLITVYKQGDSLLVKPEKELFHPTYEGIRFESYTYTFIDYPKALLNTDYQLNKNRSEFSIAQKHVLDSIFQQKYHADSVKSQLYFYFLPRLKDFPNTNAQIKKLK